MSLLSGTSWWHNSTWRDGNVEGGRLPVNQDDNEDDDDNIDDNGNGVDDNNDDDVGVWEKPRHHPLTCAWGSRSVRHPGCRCLPLIHVSGPRHSHHYHRHHNHYHHHYHHHRTSRLLLPASLTNQTASKTQQSFCLTSWSQLTTLLQSSTEYDLQNMNALGVVWVVGMTPHNGETSALMCALYVHCPVFLPLVVVFKRTWMVNGYSYHSWMLHHYCSA